MGALRCGAHRFLKRADRAVPLFRLRVEPAAGTGLRVPSDVIVDKSVTVARGKVG